MYATYRSVYDRSLEKTPEQLFINSLRGRYLVTDCRNRLFFMENDNQ